ncbi:endonuclease [Flammeovirga sp. SubArs3]|uniref:endonuclease n=1 Tax=Flammeovirga sp. SubArs3 TaxID=2995316 RepID=UPI00248BAB0B|nr:endonuclease [Flammeovirga sp. SubArs3]
MKQVFTNRLIVFLLGLFLVSCVDTEYDNPETATNAALPDDTATMTIADLKSLHTTAGHGDNDTTAIPENTTIVGQVISSDEEGNVYKELYIQDTTGGILIRIDSSPLYTQFKLGQEVAVICDELVLGSYGSNIQLGVPSLYEGSPAAGRIPSPIMKRYFFTGAEEELVTYTATVNEIQEDLDYYVGRRVMIENITVANSDKGKTFADAENESTQNRYLNDGSTDNDIILRTSGYSDFAGDTLPEGTGTLYGLVSRFRDDAQIYINTPSADLVDFTLSSNNDEDDEDEDNDNDEEEPTPSETVRQIKEAFEGTKYDDIAIEGWNNIVEEGTQGWFYNEYQSNGYANMTVFEQSEKRKVWLISPILDVTNAEFKIVSFDTRREFVDGATLKVMVSSDFNGTDAPSNASWTELNVPFSSDGTDFYGTWTNSGNIDLSSYGNVVVAFLYEGEDGVNDGGYSIDNFKFNAEEIISVDPSSYYALADGLSGYNLKSTLHNIISENYVNLGYSALWDAYTTTDDKYGEGKIVWDMYTDIPNPSNPSVPDGDQPGEHEFTQITDKDSGSGGTEEGQYYNREHSMPQSWFNSDEPMKSDIFHVIPADKKVNNTRSNNPYGEVTSGGTETVNGSILGYNADGQKVFEPIDEYKGDIARIYFYMATRYEDEISSWDQNSSEADYVFNGTTGQVFESGYLQMLLEWHEADPVSQKEIDRNEAIFLLQGNRNPYVDHPEFIDSIWK